MRKLDDEFWYSAFIYFIVGILVLLCVFPLLYVLNLSFISKEELNVRGNSVFLPHQPTLVSYQRIFHNPSIINSFFISVARTLIGPALSITFTLITGFAVSRRDLPGAKILMFMLLITILFGGGLIPYFLTVKAMGMYNTFWALVIPGILSSWSVLIFKQFFIGLPLEVEESAEIDGISKMGLLAKIILPMSLPVVSAMTLFSAVGHWNSWFDASIFIVDEKLKPLQLIVYMMNSDANLEYNARDLGTAASSMGFTAPSRGLRMALTVVGTVPILCVYPFLQKYFIKGVYVGAVKG